MNEYAGDEQTVQLFEFKAQIADYLAGLRSTPVRSLADLIAFNRKHCEQELRYFGQEVFEAADATSGDLGDPTYVAARDRARRFTRSHIDRAFDQHRLDAVIGPTFSLISSPAAVAGYPHVAVPAGFDPAGRPIGLSFFTRPWQEGKLLGLAYAFEQAAGAREAPRFRGDVPAEPARFDGCPRSDRVTATDAAARKRPRLHRRL